MKRYTVVIGSNASYDEENVVERSEKSFFEDDYGCPCLSDLEEAKALFELHANHIDEDGREYAGRRGSSHRVWVELRDEDYDGYDVIMRKGCPAKA